MNTLRWTVLIALLVLGATAFLIINSMDRAYLHIRVHDVDRITSLDLSSPHERGQSYFSDPTLVTFDDTTGNTYFVRTPAKGGTQLLTADVSSKGKARQLTCTIDYRTWRCFSEVFISPDRMSCTPCTMD